MNTENKNLLSPLKPGTETRFDCAMDVFQSDSETPGPVLIIGVLIAVATVLAMIPRAVLRYTVVVGVFAHVVGDFADLVVM